MNIQEAQQFADTWIADWNSHDLSRILGHYSEDIRFVSPFVTSLLNEPTGTLTGREALQAYFTAALAAYPALEFRLLSVLVGVGGLTMVYRSVQDRVAAETVDFDDSGLVNRAAVYYTETE
jgi:hypothetical protein